LKNVTSLEVGLIRPLQERAKNNPFRL